MDLHLRGKSALITGGSRGIGFAIANEFAAEGCNIILVSKSAENLAAAKREIDAKHRVNVTCVAADLGTVRVEDPRQARDLFRLTAGGICCDCAAGHAVAHRLVDRPARARLGRGASRALGTAGAVR